MHCTQKKKHNFLDADDEKTALDLQCTHSEDPLLEEQQQATLQRFSAFCLENGITEDQANALIQFFISEQEEYKTQSCTYTKQCLKSRWGAQYTHYLNRAKNILRIADEQMQGRLVPFFESGQGNHPLLIEMLAVLGAVIEETSITLPL